MAYVADCAGLHLQWHGTRHRCPRTKPGCAGRHSAGWVAHCPLTPGRSSAPQPFPASCVCVCRRHRNVVTLCVLVLWQSWSPVHAAPVTNWLWSLGYTPFGPFSDSQALSFAIVDAAAQHIVFSELNEQLHEVATLMSHFAVTPRRNLLVSMRAAGSFVLCDPACVCAWHLRPMASPHRRHWQPRITKSTLGRGTVCKGAYSVLARSCTCAALAW